MSRRLLEPPIQAPQVADDIAYTQGLMHWIDHGGEMIGAVQDDNRVTVYRR